MRLTLNSRTQSAARLLVTLTGPLTMPRGYAIVPRGGCVDQYGAHTQGSRPIKATSIDPLCWGSGGSPESTCRNSPVRNAVSWAQGPVGKPQAFLSVPTSYDGVPSGLASGSGGQVASRRGASNHVSNTPSSKSVENAEVAVFSILHTFQCRGLSTSHMTEMSVRTYHYLPLAEAEKDCCISWKRPLGRSSSK